jgi:hypothetical protein
MARWLLAVWLAGCGAQASQARACRPALRGCPAARLVEASQCGGDDGSVKYRSSDEAELAAERAFFASLLEAARAGEAEVRALAPTAARLGLELRVCPEGSGKVACVVEPREGRRGRGAYLIRIGAARELLVQTPHSFSDRDTLPMGLEMFRATQARALATSTLHRRGVAGYGDPGGRRPPPKGKSDVASDPRSTFQGMTLGWLDAGGGTVVQLHGYADGRTDADVVLSTGAEASAPDWVRRVKRELSELMPGRVVAVYPDDVHDLGATGNVQGRATRAVLGRFLHVEMTASLRESLRRRSSDRAAFVERLGEALLAPALLPQSSRLTE